MENNESIIELKKKLVSGEITLEEYNYSLREQEQVESNGQEEDENLPEETEEAAQEEEEQPVHKHHKKKAPANAQKNRTGFTL